jgi:translation initiation factor IF-2
MRVHELAKELNVHARDLLARLTELRIDVRNQFSTLNEADVDLARRSVAQRPVVAAPPKPKPEPPAPAKPEPVAPPAPSAPAAPAATPETPAPSAVAPTTTPEAVAKPQPVSALPASPAAPAPVAPAPVHAEAPPAKLPAPAEPARQATAVKPGKPTAKAEPTAPAKEKAAVTPVLSLVDKVIHAKGAIVVRDLAACVQLRPNRLIADLMKLNVLASINERLDVAVARKLAESYGYTLEYEKRMHDRPPVQPKRPADAEDEDRPEDLQPRPPVVTFLGHVDHGKTSLLDKIRHTQVAKGEHGGITQHIGAYTVESNGRTITFLDTPGHAAFTAMRARGANLTDIAIIIVDSADGIMPQTREAIQHAKAAGVPIMVALNKMDLPNANPERVLQQLQGEGLTPEEWGGEIICCRVSAITGDGIPHLLEMILLQSDVLELKANPKRRATGYVIEARLQPGMGPTVNLLIGEGTLKIGDAVLCGRHWGRVRALVNDHGVKVKTAGPGTPIMCLGLSGVPEAGAEFRVMANDKLARDQADAEQLKQTREQAMVPRKLSLDSLFEQMKESERLDLRLILKADTQGSVEAITHALSEIKSEKVSLSILLSGIGNVTVNDVMLASASNAVVFGFHVAKEPGVDSAAKSEGVEIRIHQIIYELLDEVRDAMSGLLQPETREKVIGHAAIRQVFTVGKTAKVAGCYITDGSGLAKSRVRVLRNKESLYQGTIESLRHFKDSVAEVREGQECGIRLTRYSDFVEGDIIEFYEVETIKQTL